MLTVFFKSSRPIAGMALLVLPFIGTLALGFGSEFDWWKTLLLAVISGGLAWLVNLFLMYRSGYIKQFFLLGWTWWFVAIGLSNSHTGIGFQDCIATLFAMVWLGFALSLHQPKMNQDIAILNLGLAAGISTFWRSDALILYPLAIWAMINYRVFNFRRLLLLVLPLAGIWALCAPLWKLLGIGALPTPWGHLEFALPTDVSGFSIGWVWALISLIPLLFQTLAAFSRAKIIKRQGLSVALVGFLLLSLWGLFVPTSTVWIPGAAAVPLALLTVNALDYIRSWWVRGIWLLGYLVSAVVSSYPAFLDFLWTWL